MNAAIKKLKSKIARGRDYEVEDILAIAKAPSQEAADALREISISEKWTRVNEDLVVPFAMWGEVVAEYCECGIPALERLIESDLHFPFVLALLEDLRSAESLRSVEQLALRKADRCILDRPYGERIVSALNLIPLSNSDVQMSADSMSAIRTFLHRYLETSDSDVEASSAFCALRAYGDETSLQLIKSYPPLPAHWETARKSAISVISKRLRGSKGS